ncbi:MAG: glutaredoxin domain-containing protein [Ilumatobacteraceae bacterium]
MHDDGSLSPDPSATPSDDEIVFYWRPGCPFCSMLRNGLSRTGLSVREVDIWEHPDAAAYVRSVANGNETVPTVAVAGVGLVNPSPQEVLALVAERAPALLPAAG